MAEQKKQTPKKEAPLEERKTVDKTSDEYLQELVEVTLFYDGDKYKDDVHVSINDKDWLIQRGKPVRVPRYVKIFIDEMEKQRILASNSRRELSQGFEDKTKEFLGK